jgi:ATP-dependent RNA helicase RhlE
MTDAAPAFADLGLREEILRAVAEKGYLTPTPIQAKAIPPILAGNDIMGGAQTGTGKTAGFTLPILQRLAHHANTSPSPARHPVRALILTPTRELAIQVAESVAAYGKYSGLRSTVVFGGVNISAQIAIVRAGIEILIATPGRLLDHIEQKTVNLSHVEIFVLDEADRMLDMGFIPDIKRIMALLPKKRQNLLFSATFSEEIRKLADQMLNHPELIEVARRNAAAETVSHLVYKCAQEQKRALLEHIVRERNADQMLVFMRTKHGASRLARQLERDGFSATAIHGDKSQSQRIEALDGFKDNKVQILVATDVAARGLDILDLPLVVNFEMPHVAEDYVHRIGRTGRAGASGEAISLVAPDEEKYLSDIEKLLKRRIELARPEGFAPPEERRSRGTANGARSHEGGRVHEGARPHEAARPARSHAAADHDATHHAPQRREARPAPHAEHQSRNGGPGSGPPRDKSHYDLNPDQPLIRKPATAIAAQSSDTVSLERSRAGTPARPIPALLRKRSA